jgi:hypothetical protein
MLVTGINAAFTGTGRQPQTNALGGDKSSKRSFEDFLAATDSTSVSQEDLDEALERAMRRMEALVGSEVAESVVNEDGTINLARFAQVMGANTRPYGTTDRPSLANAPQVVDMVA